MKRLLLLTALMLAFTFYVASYIRSETLHPTPPDSAPFDPAKLFRKTRIDKTLMAEDLIQSRTLIGLKDSDVIKIIGRPADVADTAWIYSLGGSYGAGRLVIGFSRDRVAYCYRGGD